MKFLRDNIEDIKINQILVTGFINMMTTSYLRAKLNLSLSNDLVHHIKNTVNEIDEFDNSLSIEFDNELESVFTVMSKLNEYYENVIRLSKLTHSQLVSNFDKVLKLTSDIQHMTTADDVKVESLLYDMNSDVTKLFTDLSNINDKSSNSLKNKLLELSHDTLEEVSKSVETEESKELIKKVKSKFEEMMSHVDEMINSENSFTEIFEIVKQIHVTDEKG